jgi:hypothetical protein
MHHKSTNGRNTQSKEIVNQLQEQLQELIEMYQASERALIETVSIMFV